MSQPFEVAQDRPRSVYVHLPFCLRKCSYCDFSVRVVHQQSQIRRYVDVLLDEIHWPQTKGLAIETVYFGGGTPSLLPQEEITRLAEGLRSQFDLSALQEWTLEANPETVSPSLARAWKSLGINRISLGVQSFDDRLLLLCGRTHTQEQIQRAYGILQEAGFTNISLDLIYGLPSQDLPSWEATLQAALALAPTHLSLYALQVEAATEFGFQDRQGRLPLPSDEKILACYHLAEASLQAAGFLHYEIANWSRPGRQSLHNSTYWHNLPFLAFGVGAHGYWQRKRYANPGSLPAYYQMRAAGQRAFNTIAAQSWQEEMEETAFLNLRLLQEGIHTERFLTRFGLSPWEAYGDVLQCLLQERLLYHEPPYIQLAKEAVLVSNEIFQRFLLEEDGLVATSA